MSFIIIRTFIIIFIILVTALKIGSDDVLLSTDQT